MEDDVNMLFHRCKQILIKWQLVLPFWLGVLWSDIQANKYGHAEPHYTYAGVDST